jgi:hypothetical protein
VDFPYDYQVGEWEILLIKVILMIIL